MYLLDVPYPAMNEHTKLDDMFIFSILQVFTSRVCLKISRRAVVEQVEIICTGQSQLSLYNILTYYTTCSQKILLMSTSFCFCKASHQKIPINVTVGRALKKTTMSNSFEIGWFTIVQQSPPGSSHGCLKGFDCPVFKNIMRDLVCFSCFFDFISKVFVHYLYVYQNEANDLETLFTTFKFWRYESPHKKTYTIMFSIFLLHCFV